MPALKKLISSTGLAASAAGHPNGSDTTNERASPKLRKPHKRNADLAPTTATSASQPASFIQGVTRRALRRPALQAPKTKPVDNFTRWDAIPKDNAAARSPNENWSPTAARKRFSWMKSAADSRLSLNSGSDLSRVSTFTSSYGEAEAIHHASERRDGARPPAPAISKLDWSQVNEEELAYVKSSYAKSIFDTLSPVDSAVEMPLDDRPTRKGKGKAKEGDQNRSFEADLVDDERGVAEHYRQIRDYERQLDDNDHEYALALQLEEENRIKQQQEEDERERLQLEEEDRREAERLQEEERRLAEELARSLEVECVCCGTSKPPMEYHLFTATLSCEHPIQTCIECTQTWLASELDSKGVQGLKCPECPNKLDHADVLRSASPETFASYEKFITRAVLDAIPNFTWCLSPGCESGQVNEGNKGFMKCLACDYQQCTRHQCAWHHGEACDVYEYRESGQKARDEERATVAMLDAVSKKCPGPDCGWRIQKTDGCDHMTCRRCQYQFCWQCLASHVEIKRIGNTAHDKDCKFHSDNLTASWPFNVH